MTTNSTIEDRQIRSRFNVSKSALDVVSETLTDFGTDTSHFFKHVLISGILRPETDRWTYVSEKQISKNLPGADPNSLVEADLLQKRNHNMGEDASCWRVDEEVVLPFVRHLRDTEDPEYDLFSGQKTHWAYRSKRYDDNRNPRPDLVQEAMDAVSHGYFDREALKDHVSSVDQKLSGLRTGANTEVGKSKLHGVQARWAQDRVCAVTLLNQNPIPQEENVVSYDLGYRMEESGRLTQIGGGLQGCSPAMRKEAYAGVDDLHAYHIRFSIPTMLHQFTEEAGIDAPVLEKYVREPSERRRWARNMGIDTHALEAAVSALCVAPIRSHRQDHNRERGTSTSGEGLNTHNLIVQDGLRRKPGEYNPEKACDENEHYQRLVEDLTNTLRKWRLHLQDHWIPDHKYVGHGGYWIKNEVGCSIPVPDSLEGRGLSRVLAFLLHGREAYFVHTLTVEADKYGVEVISNEHDGIMTIGGLPRSVIQTVKAKTSMQQVAVQEENPVCHRTLV